MAQSGDEKKLDSLYREDQFYITGTYNLIGSVPSGVKIRGFSGGLQFGYLRDMPVNEKRNLAIAVGGGLAFDRYGQTLFIGETMDEVTVFTVLDDDIDYDTNRFTTGIIEAPIEFRWRTSSAEQYRFWRIYAGFKVGYAFWYKSTFKQSGTDIYQTNIPEFDRLRLAATLSMGYNTFNFFAQYNINPFFNNAYTSDGQAVEFRTFKIGLMFYIL